MSPPVSIRWAELLADAVSRPGQILEAYSLFHGYSLGNQLAAMFPGLPVRVLRTHRADGIGLVQDETKYLASGGGFRKKLTSWSVQ